MILSAQISLEVVGSVRGIALPRRRSGFDLGSVLRQQKNLNSTVLKTGIVPATH